MQSIHTLSIDLETRSGADLKKTGVYRYTEDPDFGTNRPDPNVPIFSILRDQIDMSILL